MYLRRHRHIDEHQEKGNERATSFMYKNEHFSYNDTIHQQCARVAMILPLELLLVGIFMVHLNI